MKYKKYPIQIWFLDKDLRISASFLTKKTLESTIKGCLTALLSAYFYQYGIKNKKFYSYYFSKEHCEESMLKFFPLWPIKKRPTLMNFTSKTSKWTRKCKEHYNYILDYFEILLDEYNQRTNSIHNLQLCLDWLKYDAPELKIPYANIKNINLEWKVLNPKYRNKNIILGYQKQFLSLFDNYENVINEYNNINKDIPNFIIEYYKSQLF